MCIGKLICNVLINSFFITSPFLLFTLYQGKENFLTKLVEIVSQEYFAYEIKQGLFIMETLQMFFSKTQIIPRYNHLRPVVVFISDCLRRKDNMSVDVDVIQSARFVDNAVVVVCIFILILVLNIYICSLFGCSVPYTYQWAYCVLVSTSAQWLLGSNPSQSCEIWYC